MADLNARPGDEIVPGTDTETGRDGAAGSTPADAVDAVPELRATVADPRTVRARLAPGSATGDEPALSLAPNHRGSDGASDDGANLETAVLAQRQWLLDGEPVELDLLPDGHDRYRLVNRGVPSRVVLGAAQSVDGGRRRREVLIDGFRFEVDVESERIAALRERAERGRAASAHSGPLEVRAIIPGRVVSVAVAAGDSVAAGEQLLVVEAMKMQNELAAPRDGSIERVAVGPGQTIEVGDLLVVIS